MTDKHYQQERLLFLTLDPVHIGTGGSRLGRVDMAIARETGTQLPIIPGTSLAGVARSYAAYRYGKIRCAGAGQKPADKEGHCGESSCPICYTFGYAKSQEKGGHAGTVNVFDAQILLFPVSSMNGPVWVSTRKRLTGSGFQVQGAEELKNDEMALTWARNEPLNLGWLMLEVDASAVVKVTPPDEVKAKEQWAAIAERIVLVNDTLFSQVVNSNLEARTSVAIDPYTGAAQDKALFTYEAIPRATWLWGDMVKDEYREAKDRPWPVSEEYANGKDNSGDPLGETWQSPLAVAKSGLRLAEMLGVGGMSTRGFGRLKLVVDWEVQ